MEVNEFSLEMHTMLKVAVKNSTAITRNTGLVFSKNKPKAHGSTLTGTVFMDVIFRDTTGIIYKNVGVTSL